MNRDYRSDGEVIICEGPSDCHTLWFNGFPALGLPSANAWNEKTSTPFFDGIDSIYVVIEPDQGGVAVQKWLATSRIRDRVKLLSFDDGYKDPSELFIHDPDNFKSSLRQAMAKAVPLAEVMDQQAATEKARLWEICRTLAEDRNILSSFSQCIERLGVAGESKNANGESKGNLGNSSGDTFWSASRIILEQCFELLKPNGHAIFVCKDYIKAKKRVPFSDRWLALCESVGFKLVCRHQAMLVKSHGTQVTIHGDEEITTERKSFFRRLAESKGSPRIDEEDVICLEKPCSAK
jgi:hypothetical protein